MGRKLSRREAHRIALHFAINERDSFAGAHSPDEPAAIRAVVLAAELRRVLLEEFGEIIREDYLIQNPGTSISLFDLVIGPKQDFKA